MLMENVTTIVLAAKNRKVTDAIINRPGFYTVVVKSSLFYEILKVSLCGCRGFDTEILHPSWATAINTLSSLRG